MQRFQERNIAPTFAELADLDHPAARIAPLAGLDRTLDSRNLFRSTGSVGSMAAVPTMCPTTSNSSEMTGVEARILLAIGNRFPMIRHRVLGRLCLVRVTGRFDPTAHRAVAVHGQLRPRASPSRASWIVVVWPAPRA